MLSIAGTQTVVAEQQSPPPFNAATYHLDAKALSVRRDVLISTPTPSQPSAAYQLKLSSWGACSSLCGGGTDGLHAHSAHAVEA